MFSSICSHLGVEGNISTLTRCLISLRLPFLEVQAGHFPQGN